MASLPNYNLGDYSEEEIDRFLGLLTPPAIFHSKESQQEIPATNPNERTSQSSSLPSTIPPPSPGVLARIPSSTDGLTPMPCYTPIPTQRTPIPPSHIPSSLGLPSQVMDEMFPMTSNTQIVISQSNVSQSQAFHVNFSQDHDPILEQIKREFESASSVLTQEFNDRFEFDEDLEQEFSQACSNEVFSMPSSTKTPEQPKQEVAQEPTKKSLFPADVTLIPLSVSKLFDQITSHFSDFAFVFAVAAQMCQDLLPMDSFIHLKIGLLLSLASIEVEGRRPPISIIALGKESSSANLLMTNIGNAARKFVSPTEDFTTGQVKDNFVKFGPLQLARTGICYIGNWNRLKPQLLDKMFKSLETGKLIIEGSTMSMPLQCAVWGYWNAYKHNTKDQHVFNKFFE